LAIGGCLTDARGEVVSAARNSTNEMKGAGLLSGSPIAHAEMSLLAERRHNEDLSGWIMWGTHRPCPMCAAAMEFVGVGSATYLAEDPISRKARTATLPGSQAGLAPWETVANVLLARSLVLLPEEKRKQETMTRAALESTRLAAGIWPDRDGADDRGMHDILRTFWAEIVEIDNARQSRS
jgi:hypothetical protein